MMKHFLLTATVIVATSKFKNCASLRYFNNFLQLNLFDFPCVVLLVLEASKNLPFTKKLDGCSSETSTCTKNNLVIFLSESGCTDYFVYQFKVCFLYECLESYSVKIDCFLETSIVLLLIVHQRC